MSWTLSWYASAWPSPDSSTANDRNSASGGSSLSSLRMTSRAALTSSSRFSTRASPLTSVFLP